ncbi:hypothetical protein C5S39_06325 [Candidatus Methanophagaceae archaeon]|nr:hypothetical protein C5S39_06325 [Methanophagales archaeon]
MEIDKISIGLIAGIIVCAMMAFALPAIPVMADHNATQTATISKSSTFEFYNQTGDGADTIVSALSIVGTVGEELIGEGLYNDIDGSENYQNISDHTKPIARIKNTDTDTELTAWVMVTAGGNWDARIYTEHCKLTPSGSTPNAAADIDVDLSTWNTECNSDHSIVGEAYANLWIRVVPESSGTAGESTFTVLGEG